MKQKKIFIFEFISGGGFNQDEIPPSLFCEGFGMLRAIIEDFKALNYEISTILDNRIQSSNKFLKADEIKIIDSEQDIVEVFMDSIEKCDYCFIIAPEFSDILYNFTQLANGKEKTVLSIGLAGIKLASSKIETFRFFEKYDILTPKTYQIPLSNNFIDKEFVYDKFNEFDCPIIIKLDDGVGAGQIFHFETISRVDELFESIEEFMEKDSKYVIQEFIEGDHLSVSLIGTSKDPLILSINAQFINIKNSLNGAEYWGGYTPVKNSTEIEEEITRILQKLDLSEFIGYFGIDFIRKNDGTIYFIEINPRLTTSYIGLRRILDNNSAQLIINSKFNHNIPTEVKLTNKSLFRRVELEYCGKKTVTQIYETVIPKLIEVIPEFISPPISLKDEANEKKLIFSCFLAIKEKNAEAANKRFGKITEILGDYDFKDLYSNK